MPKRLEIGTAVAFAAAVALLLNHPQSVGGAQQTGVAAIQKAGAAWTDITPLPGLPTGGAGPAGAITRGYWDRLRAVAFYFEDPAGRGFALVSTDLFGMPTGLHQSVSAYFTATNPGNRTGVVLPLERLVIAATHTHLGPGNYLSAEAYNAHGSKRSGFNAPLRAFLETRIIEAIEGAVADARSRPADTLDLLTGSADSTLFRNRSPKVFLRDPLSSTILGSLGAGIPSDAASCTAARMHHEPEDDWDIEGCPRLRAVDRNITLLRMRHGGTTHALAVFVNVHPTLMRLTTELYSGDLFGMTRSRLEDRFGAAPPVIGFFNGSEGDVVTRRTTRTATDLAMVGESFARQIQQIHDQAQPAPVDLSRGIHGRLHFAHPGDVEPATGPPSARLAAEATAGVATIGGAEGDETLFHPFTWWRTRPATGDQGVKRPALGWLRHLVAPARTFPRALPLGVVRLGGLTLIATPTENSTTAVWQMRHALGHPPHGALEVVSMANEYASYLASGEEYAAQDYMGASTLWGPQQADFFAAVLRRLASEGDGTTGAPGVHAPGPTRTFRPGDVGWRRGNITAGYDRFLEGGLVDDDELPAFEWCEPGAVAVGAGERTIEVVAVDGSSRDRHGIAVVLRGLRTNPERAVWGAMWLTPLWSERRGVYRFRVIDGGGHTIESERFAVGTSPPGACPAR